MSFQRLPPELVIMVAENLGSERDMSAFARASRSHCALTTSTLYRRNIQNSKSSALGFAARKGYFGMAEELLKLGADVEAGQSRGRTPFVQAVANNHPQIARLLLEHGAEENLKQPDYSRLVPWAVWFGQSQVVRSLVGKSAGVIADQRDVARFFDNAVCAGEHKIVRMVLEHGAEVDASSSDGETALILTSRNGDIETARVLLEHGADIHRTGKCYPFGLQDAMLCHGPPLDEAVRAGNTAMVEYLLNHGADVNMVDARRGEESGHNALESAIIKNDTVTAVLLLDRGARVDLPSYFGTPLHAVAAQGNTVVLHKMLDRGADVEARSSQYGTPLTAAAYHGRSLAVRLLLRHGANPNTRPGYLYFSVKYVRNVETWPAVAQLMREHGWVRDSKVDEDPE